MIASSVSDHYLQNNPSDLVYLAYDSCHIHFFGTSMAAPHITGLVALMLEHDPELDFYDVINCLESTAINGKVNAYAALDCIGAIPCYGECGNANAQGVVNVADAVWIINFVFAGGDPPQPVLACGNANGQGVVNVADAVWIINFVFAGGDPPGDCDPGNPLWTDGDCCPLLP